MEWPAFVSKLRVCSEEDEAEPFEPPDVDGVTRVYVVANQGPNLMETFDPLRGQLQERAPVAVQGVR